MLTDATCSICPGRFFAQDSMFAFAAGILAAFTIVPATSSPPEIAFEGALIR